MSNEHEHEVNNIECTMYVVRMWSRVCVCVCGSVVQKMVVICIPGYIINSTENGLLNLNIEYYEGIKSMNWLPE